MEALRPAGVKAEAEDKQAELLGLEAQAKEIMEEARERKQAMEIERVKFDNELKDMERVKGEMAEERAGLDGRDAALAEAELLNGRDHQTALRSSSCAWISAGGRSPMA